MMNLTSNPKLKTIECYLSVPSTFHKLYLFNFSHIYIYILYIYLDYSRLCPWTLGLLSFCPWTLKTHILLTELWIWHHLLLLEFQLKTDGKKWTKCIHVTNRMRLIRLISLFFFMFLIEILIKGMNWGYIQSSGGKVRHSEGILKFRGSKVEVIIKFKGHRREYLFWNCQS